MPVNMKITLRKSPTGTGEVELLEFFAQRRACDDRDREIVCSDARASARGIGNAWLAVAARHFVQSPLSTSIQLGIKESICSKVCFNRCIC